MKKLTIACILVTVAVAGFWMFSFKAPADVKPDPDNAGLILPDGFGALKVFDPPATPAVRSRHLVVTPQGDVYVHLARPVEGKGTYFLRDTNNDGKFDEKTGFGDYGGTGIYLKNGYLYVSSNTEVFRYKLDAKSQVIDAGRPERIVMGLKMGRQHETKSIVLDNDDNIYVNIGAPSNSCQVQDRGLHSPGIPGCPLLDSAGGIWQFKINKADQSYAQGTRYATGLRNVVGLDWNQQTNSLFVMQHGRDNLNTIFPEMFDTKQSALLPAECMYELKKGDNAGWPYVYYDQLQQKLMQAPEYGGDGKKEASPDFLRPLIGFPGHMAPNALLFYTGNQFPAKYKNGAFIAFHGSWNRAPEPQAGFFVVFQPFKNGKPDGNWEVFADGFSGSPQKTASGRADHRPCGIAQGPDGSIYVTDDVKGTIYRIVYQQK
jgi:glucose/arabinose dehydrogenase